MPGSPPLEEVAESAPPRRRIRRAFLWFLLVLVVAGGFARSRLDEWVRVHLELRLAESLNADVHIGEVELGLFRLSGSIQDVEVRFPALPEGSAAPEANAAQSRIAIDSGQVRLRLATLTALSIGRIHLAELSVDGVRGTVRGPVEAAAVSDQGDESPLSLIIDRLNVTSGVVRYEDEAIPLEFDVADLRVDASRGRSRLIGNLSFGYGILVDPLAQELPLEVSTAFRWQGGELDLVRIHAVGGGLNIESHSEISWSPDQEIQAVGSYQIDLDRLGALLRDDVAKIAGSANGSFQLAWGESPLAVRAHLKTGPSRLGVLRFQSVQADARYKSGRLSLENIKAAAFDGDVKGAVELDLFDGPDFEARLDGLDLRADQLLQFVGVSLPVGGRVDAQVVASGDSRYSSSWTGQGDFVMRADHAIPDLLPTRSRGEVSLVPGQLSLHAEPVHVSSTRLVLNADVSVGGPDDGSRSGQVRLSGDVSDAHETQRGTLQILEALGVEVPVEIREPLYGTGTASARVSLGAEADFGVALNLVSGALGDRPFNRFDIDLSVLGDRMSVAHLDIADDVQRLAGSAELITEPLSILTLDAEAEQLDARWITERLPEPLPMTGRITGALNLQRGGAGFEGDGTLAFSDGRYLDEPIDSAAAQLVFVNNVLRLTAAELHAPAGDFSGAVTVDLGTLQTAIEIDKGALNLAGIEALKDAELPLEGWVDVSGAIAFDAHGGGSGSVQLHSPSSKAYGYPLGIVEGQVDMLPLGFRVQLRESVAETWETQAQIDWTGDWPVTGSLRVADFPVGDSTNAGLPLAALVTGVLDYRGPLADPARLILDGSVAAMRLDVGTRSLNLEAPVEIGYAAGSIETGPIRMQGTGSQFTADVRYNLDDPALIGKLDGKVNLALLTAWVPDMQMSGQAAVDLRVSGPMSGLQANGAIFVDQGRLRWTEFPETLEQLDIDLRIDGDQVEARTLRAVVGGGEVSGNGEMELDGLVPVSFVADLGIDSMRLELPEDFEGVYDGTLRVEGDLEQIKLSSTARLIRGLYNEPFELSGLLGFGEREVLVATGPDAPYPVLLDLDVTAPGGVWLRNDLAEVETAVDLYVGGTVLRPEITGQITSLEGGELLFRDVEYQIESASLEFVDRERLNPYLSLQARTTVQAYEVLLRVEGTQDDFKYELTSNPALSSQDIIALLTTGHTLQDLTGTERASSNSGNYSGDVAANYFAGALTGRFEKQLQRLLGLERVRIDPLLVEGEGDPTTRITIGKEVADDLFVILSSDVGDTERQIYQVEWQASQKIRLTAERNELGSVGGDIQFTDRFRLKKHRDAVAPGVIASTSQEPSSPVSFIAIEGVTPSREEALLKRVPLAVGRPFSRSQLFDGLQALRRTYVREGRIETRVRSAAHVDEDTGEVAVSYIVEPGAKISVEFEGVKKKDEKRLRALLEELWIDSFFKEDLNLDSAATIQTYFQERGYYAVDVDHERAETNGRQRLIFRVDRGKPVTVEEVTISGTNQVDNDRIKRQMLTREPSFLTRKHLEPDVLEEDLRAIRNLYWTLGFLDVRVDPPRVRLSASADRATLKLNIHEGRQFEIASVAFPEDRPFTKEELQAWSGLAVGDVFSPQRLVEAEGSLRSAIDERGYADAGVRARFELGEAVADVSFEIDPGQIKRVGEISIAGNRSTKRKVIEREIDLKVGDLISRSGLARVQHRLYSLGIFRSVRVGYRPLEGNPDAQLLEVNLEEAEPLGISVGGGYENQGDARARLSLTHDNLAGRDRTVGLHARTSRLVQRLQLTAEDRHLFGTGTPGLLNLAYEEREETAFTVNRRSIAVRADRRWNPKWSGFLRYSFQRVDLLDVTDALAAREDKLSDISLGDIGIVILRDTRDDPFLTRQGSLFSAETHVFNDAFLSEADFVKSTFTGAYVHTFNNGTALALVGRLGLAKPYRNTKQVPLSERFFAGGDSTLRGFSRDDVGPKQDGLPFGGEAMLVFNEEFLFPLWTPLKGVVFLDIGNVYETMSDLDLNEFREVAGTGLRLETAIGPIRLEYGWKLDRRTGESPGEWVLAIGMAF